MAMSTVSLQEIYSTLRIAYDHSLATSSDGGDAGEAITLHLPNSYYCHLHKIPSIREADSFQRITQDHFDTEKKKRS
jgi:hypothetical protein